MTQIFLDTETTGVDHLNDSIVQLSCVVRVDGKETERHDWFMKPYKRNPMAPEATAVSGYTQEMVDGFPDNTIALKEFREMLDRYNLGSFIPGTGLKNKAFVVGYNVDFDIQMIHQWFEANSYYDLWYKIWSPPIDVMQFAALPFSLKGIRLHMKNFKLITLYKTIYEEDFPNAHNSMADVLATMRIYDSLVSKYFPETLPETTDNL